MRISTTCHASRMQGTRPLSLASLTALHLPPPDLVRYAAAAGFDLVGALHLARAGGRPTDLDALGPGRLPYVQLCDAASAAPADTDPEGLRRAVAEAVGHRLPPGEGVLPLAGLLSRIDAGAPVSLEV